MKLLVRTVFVTRLATFVGMLSLSLSLAVGAAVVTPREVSASHLLPPGTKASEYCEANDDFGISHGGCVSFFTSDGRSKANLAALCKDPAFVAIIEAASGKSGLNHGQCMKAQRALRP